MPARPTLLLISQVYVPDPASVGQHMHDAAAELARRGHRVVVLASARGYDDPTRRYPTRETIDGVEVRRLPLSSFGKASIPVRLLGAGLFMVQCIAHGLFLGGLGRILVSTSPPMAAMAALVIATARRVPIKYWVMDLNPDQMVELGKARAGSPAVRAYDAFNRAILRRSADVVALDRFNMIEGSRSNFFTVEIVDPNLDSTAVFNALLERGVIVKDGTVSFRGYGDRYLRVDVSLKPHMDRFLSALSELDRGVKAVG